MVDRTRDILIVKRRLGQVTIMDVPREDDYGGGGLAFLSGCYGPYELGELDERVVE